MKSKIKHLLIIPVLVQIFILIISTPAYSYQIKESITPISPLNIDKKNFGVSNILSDVTNLLIAFLTIKQIGFVSADSGNYCCEKLSGTNNWCVEMVLHKYPMRS